MGQVTKDITKHPDVASNLALLQVWLKSRMAYAGLPGMMVAIVHDQDLFYAKGFGYADVANQIPATPDSIFRIASHSKLFTAIAVMQLRDAGKLNLDTPLAAYLPWFVPDDSFPDSPALTLRQVLSHTTGLPREAGSGYWLDFDFPTIEELKRRVPRLGRKIKSERSWKYSNLAPSLAGEVVAAVSGLSYADYVRQMILEPLGMNSTSVVFPEVDQDRLAVGYGRRMPDGSRETFPFVDAQSLAAATGFSSSVKDMARFMSWQFRLLDTDGAEVLKANTLREMQRIHWMNPDWLFGWGLGFMIEHKKERDLIGHSGGYPGYLSKTRISPKEKLGVVVFANALDGEPAVVNDRAFEWLGPAVAKFNEDDPGKEPHPNWHNYEGLYRSIWGDSQVLFIDGKLRLLYPNTPDPKAFVYTLEPDGEQQFKVDGPGFGSPGEQVLFELGEDGRAVRMKSGDAWVDRVEE